MSTDFDLAEKLADWNPSPFVPVPGAYIYSDETPAHKFVTVVSPTLDGKYCVDVSSRDFFDEWLARAVINFVMHRASVLSTSRPLTILEGFTCPDYGFDAVAVLNPSSANQYEHVDDLLNARAFVAFPIYRCELSGDESADIVDLIRHDFLPSPDWKRPPCPKVSMAFHNTKTTARSTHLDPRLTSWHNVLSEVKSLFGAEGSWIELENYAGRQCRIELSNGHYKVSLPGRQPVQVDPAAVIELLTQFVMCDQY